MEFASVAYFLAVDLGDHVTDLQASSGAGRVGFNLRNYPAGCIGFVKELRVLGSHVRDPDADVAVAHFAVADQRLDRGPDNLRGNRKSHAGECAGRRNQEGVDADDLTASVNQGAAGVAGVDGRIRLDEGTGLAGIIRVRIGPIESAHDAARDGEAESVGIAEG